MGERNLLKAQEMPAVYHEWLVWLPGKENTKGHYGRGLRRVIGFADIEPGSFGPASLDQKTVKSAFSTMQSESVTDVALKQCLVALKSFFDYCRANDLVDTVPDLYWIQQMSRVAVAHQEPECYH